MILERRLEFNLYCGILLFNTKNILAQNNNSKFIRILILSEKDNSISYSLRYTYKGYETWLSLSSSMFFGG